MVLAYLVILLVGLALLFRRDLSALGKIPYRGDWKLISIVFGLYILQAAFIVYVAGQTVLQMAILILSQIALICLLALNRHVPGAWLFMLGIALNSVVMVANGGWMPITPENYRYVHPERTIELQTRPPNSKNIISLRSNTTLWVLSDIIRIKLWRRWAASIGDFLLIAGVAQFIFQGTAAKSPLLTTNS